MNTSYVYPGFRPFADKAAEDYEIPEAERHRVSLGPLFREIDDAVSRLPDMADRERRMLVPEGSTKDLVGRVAATREILAAQLAAVDAAVAEVLTAIGHPRTVAADAPAPAETKPESPKPKRRTRTKAEIEE